MPEPTPGDVPQHRWDRTRREKAVSATGVEENVRVKAGQHRFRLLGSPRLLA